jgi:hypothetical protein
MTPIKSRPLIDQEIEELDAFLLSDDDTRRPIHKVLVPRRNDPCLCGSGKKFKHCHGSASKPALQCFFAFAGSWIMKSIVASARAFMIDATKDIGSCAWDRWRASRHTPVRLRAQPIQRIAVTECAAPVGFGHDELSSSTISRRNYRRFSLGPTAMKADLNR